MAAHQALPSLRFSRQEHWSGLPFPSPMHESEKWKWSRSVGSNSSWPHGLQPTRLLHPWDFPGKSTGVGCHRLLQMECYSAIKKKNERIPFEATRMLLEIIILSKVSLKARRGSSWALPRLLTHRNCEMTNAGFLKLLNLWYFVIQW